MTDFFTNKKNNKAKLLKFGFTQEDGLFIYKQILPDNKFNLTVFIDDKGKLHTKLIDPETNELYTLHLLEGVSGNFAGKIKKEYEQILQKIAGECFDPDVFKTRQANDLIKYIKEKYNDEPEFLWEKFAGNAIVRRKDNLKWYAAFLSVSKQKLGFSETSSVEIIDLRTIDADKIIDNKTVFPGYHMNKKHWITIILDNSVPMDYIKKRIDESYILAKKNKK